MERYQECDGVEMTTKKEYAISLGLAKPGRGRMSLAAHDAIDKAISEGVVFTDSLTPPPHSKPKPKPIVPKAKPVRKVKGNLKGFTPEGWPVGFRMCRTCAKDCNYCRCRTFGLPAIVDTLEPKTAVILGLI